MDRPTILVIDYEPRNLAATVEPLTAAGYRVEVARDGVSGLDAFRRLQPHVVFMEAMLPKKHAFEVCQEIRRAKPGKQTRVFILGAPTIAQSQQSKAVHQYGADRFLSRPVDGPTLVALCSSVLPGPDAPQVPEMDLLEPLAPEVEAVGSTVPPGRLDLASMTEDDIMAQLDQLLPSVPGTVAAPPPAPLPVPLKAPSPPRTAAPRAQSRPAPAPLPAPAPVIRAAAPAPVPPPAPRPAAPPVEAAPVPLPARSRAPMVAAGVVLALAGAGTWMLFRPGAAPVVAPAPAAPRFEEAPADLGAVPEPEPVLPVEAPLAVVETARPQAEPAPPPPAPPREARPQERVQTPPPERPVVAKAEPAPTAVRPAAKEPPAVTEPAPEPAASGAGAPEIPLPIAPPRLEPLPVGSDAARPRISPEIFRPKTQAGARVELSEVDQAPVPVSRPAPVYPPAARQMRREGEVGLRLLVDAEGQVASVEVVTGSAKSDLAAAAIRAARTWRYRPAMKDGVPVQVRIVEKVVFKL